MKKYYFLIVISILLLPIFVFAWINNAVSKQYETEYGECISATSGQNLCVIGIVITLIIILLFISLIFGIYKVINPKK